MWLSQLEAAIYLEIYKCGLCLLEAAKYLNTRECMWLCQLEAAIYLEAGDL